MFTRKQIAEAKVGSHWIIMDPYKPAYEMAVDRVRGDFVWIYPVNAKDVSSGRFTEEPFDLNQVCSRMLIEGGYRRL